MVSGVTDITIEPGCGKVKDPDMALSCSLDLDNTMVPGHSPGHQNQSGPNGTTLRYQIGHIL